MSNYINSYKDLFSAASLPVTETPQVTLRDHIGRLKSLIVTWYQRAQQRRRLSELDARMLRDIGLSEQDVFEETNKPFWKA